MIAMEEERRLPGWVFPVAGVVAVVALVVIGLNREPTNLDPDTPEGTVQIYLDALGRGDFDTASTLWASTGCVPASKIPTTGVQDVSAALVSVDRNDIQATVAVTITESSADPLAGLYEHDEWFTLINEDGDWKIQQPSWPYWDQICEETA
jgi:hypothetical protein